MPILSSSLLHPFAILQVDGDNPPVPLFISSCAVPTCCSSSGAMCASSFPTTHQEWWRAVGRDCIVHHLFSPEWREGYYFPYPPLSWEQLAHQTETFYVAVKSHPLQSSTREEKTKHMDEKTDRELCCWKICGVVGVAWVPLYQRGFLFRKYGDNNQNNNNQNSRTCPYRMHKGPANSLNTVASFSCSSSSSSTSARSFSTMKSGSEDYESKGECEPAFYHPVEGYVQLVVVPPLYRGRGIAKELLHYCFTTREVRLSPSAHPSLFPSSSSSFSGSSSSSSSSLCIPKGEEKINTKQEMMKLVGEIHQWRLHTMRPLPSFSCARDGSTSCTSGSRNLSSSYPTLSTAKTGAWREYIRQHVNHTICEIFLQHPRRAPQGGQKGGGGGGTTTTMQVPSHKNIVIPDDACVGDNEEERRESFLPLLPLPEKVWGEEKEPVRTPPPPSPRSSGCSSPFDPSTLMVSGETSCRSKRQADSPTCTSPAPPPLLQEEKSNHLSDTRNGKGDRSLSSSSSLIVFEKVGTKMEAAVQFNIRCTIKLYESFGFTQRRFLPCYYGDLVDATEMILSTRGLDAYRRRQRITESSLLPPSPPRTFPREMKAREDKEDSQSLDDDGSGGGNLSPLSSSSTTTTTIILTTRSTRKRGNEVTDKLEENFSAKRRTPSC